MKRRHFIWNFIVAMCSLGLPWAKAWELSKAQTKGDLTWFAMWDKELKASVIHIINGGWNGNIVLSVPFSTTKDPNFPWGKSLPEIAAKYGALKESSGYRDLKKRDGGTAVRRSTMWITTKEATDRSSLLSEVPNIGELVYALPPEYDGYEHYGVDWSKAPYEMDAGKAFDQAFGINFEI